MIRVHPLKAYRESRDLSLEQMATQLGVKKSTIWRWENGKRRPEDKYLPVISRLTGASIPSLMGLDAA